MFKLPDVDFFVGEDGKFYKDNAPSKYNQICGGTPTKWLNYLKQGQLPNKDMFVNLPGDGNYSLHPEGFLKKDGKFKNLNAIRGKTLPQWNSIINQPMAKMQKPQGEWLKGLNSRFQLEKHSRMLWDDLQQRAYPKYEWARKYTPDDIGFSEFEMPKTGYVEDRFWFEVNDDEMINLSSYKIWDRKNGRMRNLPVKDRVIYLATKCSLVVPTMIKGKIEIFCGKAKYEHGYSEPYSDEFHYKMSEGDISYFRIDGSSSKDFANWVESSLIRFVHDRRMVIVTPTYETEQKLANIMKSVSEFYNRGELLEYYSSVKSTNEQKKELGEIKAREEAEKNSKEMEELRRLQTDHLQKLEALDERKRAYEEEMERYNSMVHSETKGAELTKEQRTAWEQWYLEKFSDEDDYL